VDVLPHVFEGVNQNFVSVAVKGVLQMVRGYTSIDFEALRGRLPLVAEQPAMQPPMFLLSWLSGPRLGVEAPVGLCATHVAARALALGGQAPIASDLPHESLAIRGPRLRSLEIESVLQWSIVGGNLPWVVLEVEGLPRRRNSLLVLRSGRLLPRLMLSLHFVGSLRMGGDVSPVCGFRPCCKTGTS
jgi:hypothetical protein